MSSNPLCPCGKGSPTPSLWGRSRSVPRSRGVFLCSQWPQEGSISPKMASRMAPHTTRCLKMASEMSPKRSQARHKTIPCVHGAIQGYPRDVKIIENYWFFNDFDLPTFSCLDGSSRPSDVPKIAQETPKRSPKGLQDGRQGPREHPKSVPRGPQETFFRAQEGWVS